MLTLAFESSAKAASVALVRDGDLISQYSQCSGLTHSRTLLPMAEDMLKNAELSLNKVDIFAVAHGPGSFTGIRIGVSPTQGLSWPGPRISPVWESPPWRPWPGTGSPPAAISAR